MLILNGYMNRCLSFCVLQQEQILLKLGWYKPMSWTEQCLWICIWLQKPSHTKTETHDDDNYVLIFKLQIHSILFIVRTLHTPLIPWHIPPREATRCSVTPEIPFYGTEDSLPSCIWKPSLYNLWTYMCTFLCIWYLNLQLNDFF